MVRPTGVCLTKEDHHASSNYAVGRNDEESGPIHIAKSGTGGRLRSANAKPA